MLILHYFQVQMYVSLSIFFVSTTTPTQMILYTVVVYVLRMFMKKIILAHLVLKETIICTGQGLVCDLTCSSSFKVGFTVLCFYVIQALLRPGRFDRHIMIDYPTLIERVELFELYLSKLKLKGPVSAYATRLAQLSPGKSGKEQQLANFMILTCNGSIYCGLTFNFRKRI